MDIVLVILGIIGLVAGLVGCFAPVIPGPPLSYLGLLFIAWSRFGEIGIPALIVWGVIVLLVTILDFVLPSWMTQRFGGSKYAGYGSFIGLLVGLPLGIPGLIIGPFLGALIGEIIFLRTPIGQATQAATGSLLAFFIGSGIKMAICIGIIIAAFVAVV